MPITLTARNDQSLKVYIYTDQTKTTRMNISSGVSEIRMTVKPEWAMEDADDANALFQKSLTGGGIAITDGENGEITVTLEDTDTAEATVRENYFYDVQLVFASGAKRTVVLDRAVITIPVTKT